MAYQHFEPISKQLTIVVGLTVVGFMAFGLALSFYRNVLFEQTLAEIRTQNDALRGKIAQGYRDLEYYKSAQYKDKYAKENLGMVKHDEKLLIITDKPPTTDFATQPNDSLSDQREAAFLELLRQMPVIEHWKLYFFYRDKIEELKKSL